MGHVTLELSIPHTKVSDTATVAGVVFVSLYRVESPSGSSGADGAVLVDGVHFVSLSLGMSILYTLPLTSNNTTRR